MLSLFKTRGWVGVRDEALIRLMMDSGVRVSEALTLNVEDVQLDERTAFVRRGKGQKDGSFI